MYVCMILSHGDDHASCLRLSATFSTYRALVHYLSLKTTRLPPADCPLSESRGRLKRLISVSN